MLFWKARGIWKDGQARRTLDIKLPVVAFKIKQIMDAARASCLFQGITFINNNVADSTSLVYRLIKIH